MCLFIFVRGWRFLSLSLIGVEVGIFEDFLLGLLLIFVFNVCFWGVEWLFDFGFLLLLFIWLVIMFVILDLRVGLIIFLFDNFFLVWVFFVSLVLVFVFFLVVFGFCCCWVLELGC